MCWLGWAHLHYRKGGGRVGGRIRDGGYRKGCCVLQEVEDGIDNMGRMRNDLSFNVLQERGGGKTERLVLLGFWRRRI